jgi:5'-nucleotidase
VPNLPAEEIKGLKICRQAHAFWADRFDKRLDQFGKPYYWLTGEFSNEDRGEDTDLMALEHGYASIVPTQFDMTAYKTIEHFKNWIK